MESLATIKQIILNLKPELTDKYHVSSIGIFGSVARGESNMESDIDLIVEFSHPLGIEFIDLADRLEDALHSKVDLVSRKGVRQEYFQYIKDEIVYV